MTYQQAQAIKKRSFSELMAMNIASGGSITGSFGRTIAQKTKARATRFKEKFDPLNIAKFMTGGSRLGPAMLGRLMGRSQRDIEYFSGVRARPISGGKYTKIGKVQEQSDLMPVLEKIYGFLKKTNEDDIKRKELEKNFQEENKLEDERRHQELIKALTGKETATIVKKKDAEPAGNMFGDFMKSVKDMIDSALGAFQKVVEKMIEGALKSFQWIQKAAPWLGRVLMSPAFLAFAGFALAGYALWELTNWIAKNTPDYKTIKDPEQAKNILENATSERDIDAAGGREYLTGLIEKEKENARLALENPEITAEERAKYEKIAGMTVTPRIQTARPVPPRPDTTGGKNMQRAKNWDAQFGETHNPDGSPKKNTQAKPLPQGVEESKAGAGRGMAVLEDYNARKEPTGAVFGVRPKGIKSAPVSAPKSNLNNVIQDNQNLKLEDKIGKAVESSVNNTSVSNLTTSPPQKKRIPSVRNMEETFQRMIYNSTRVV